MSQILEYKEGEFLVKYPRLPLAPRILSYKDCDPLLASMAAMTANWKKRLLSHAGMVQLFHWGFMGVFNFWNQTCRLPKQTLKAVTSLAYNYIWAGKRDLAWKTMVLSNGRGGIRT